MRAKSGATVNKCTVVTGLVSLLCGLLIWRITYNRRYFYANYRYTIGISLKCDSSVSQSQLRMKLPPHSFHSVCSPMSPLLKALLHRWHAHGFCLLWINFSQLIRMHNDSYTLKINTVFLHCVSPQECLYFEGMGGESSFITFTAWVLSCCLRLKYLLKAFPHR